MTTDKFNEIYCDIHSELVGYKESPKEEILSVQEMLVMFDKSLRKKRSEYNDYYSRKREFDGFLKGNQQYVDLSGCVPEEQSEESAKYKGDHWGTIDSYRGL